MSFGLVAATGIGAVATMSASKSASKAQRKAADKASATELKMFNLARKDQLPSLERGNAAGDELMYRLGLGGGVGTSPANFSAKTEAQIRQELLPEFRTGGAIVPVSNGFNNDGDPRYNGEYRLENTVVDDVALARAVQQRMQQQAQEKAAFDAKRSAQQNALKNDPKYGSLLRNFGTSDLASDPIYQERLRVGIPEGQNNIMRMMSSRGGLESGATMKALSRFNQDYAGGEGVNAFNRFQVNRSNVLNPLQALAGVGQTAASQLGNQAIQTGNQIASNQIGAGNARASGYMGQANALTGAIGQGVNAWQQNQLMKNMFPTNSMAGYSNTGSGFYPYGGSNLDVGNIS